MVLGLRHGAEFVASPVRRVRAPTSVATFMPCHVNALEIFGDVPRPVLYDNTQCASSGSMPAALDFALRVGLDFRLCRPYERPDEGPGGKRGEASPGVPATPAFPRTNAALRSGWR
jgi:transposase